MSLGKEIKKARIDKGWKQQDLQAATGLSQKYLSAVELDKAHPSFDVMKQIARALGVSLDTFAKEDEEAAVSPPTRQRRPPTARHGAAPRPAGAPPMRRASTNPGVFPARRLRKAAAGRALSRLARAFCAPPAGRGLDSMSPPGCYTGLSLAGKMPCT